MDNRKQKPISEMEKLDTTNALFVLDDVVEDDLLNFTLEEGEQGFKVGDSDVSSSSSNPSKTAAFSHEESVEEDLEWVSNKDAFPPVETCFGILSNNPKLVLSHKSPISVLYNSTSSNNTNSHVASSCGSLKIPVQARSKKHGRKRRAHFADVSSQHDLVNVMTPPVNSGDATLGRRCLHCQAEKTPQWRAGPMGPKTLCNACGVRYKSGRLLAEYRPANSPTFSSELHSNSHRKVVEMRKKQRGEE